MKGGEAVCLEGEGGLVGGVSVVGVSVVGGRYSETESVGECENMLCEHPWMALPTGTDSKRLMLSREAKEAMTPRPCGQCLSCRINKSRIWAQRIMLESMVTQPCSFVTLTYNDEHLPEDKSLNPRHLTLFFKLLRKYLGSNKIRYFAVGEYGSEGERPHYHIILFGVGADCQSLVEKSWPHGFIHVGFLTEQSARYVTGYVVKGMKKGDSRLEGRYPEFMRCSKMSPGGLGAGAINQAVASIKESGANPTIELRKLSKGKKGIPLGRYLKDKLKAAIPGQSEMADRNYAEWQEQFLNLNGVGVYTDVVTSLRSAERERNYKRHHFFKRRNQL